MILLSSTTKPNPISICKSENNKVGGCKAWKMLLFLPAHWENKRKKQNKSPQMKHAVEENVKSQTKRARAGSSAPLGLAHYPPGAHVAVAVAVAGPEGGPAAGSLGVTLMPPPHPAPCCSLLPWAGARAWLPSANPQGPGSTETVRLIQNMCKMIFYKQS